MNLEGLTDKQLALEAAKRIGWSIWEFDEVFHPIWRGRYPVAVDWTLITDEDWVDVFDHPDQMRRWRPWKNRCDLLEVARLLGYDYQADVPPTLLELLKEVDND